MNKKAEVKIHQFQLRTLLDEERMEVYNTILAKNVYCNNCRGEAKEGIDVEEVVINHISDIIVRGRCKICKGKVARYFEFGENDDFFDKVVNFKNSLKN